MDCKKALAATSFDMEAAFDELRKRGLAAASKKAGRAAADGLVGCDVSACGRFAAVVEVNAETDFAAKNDVFLSLVADAAKAVAAHVAKHPATFASAAASATGLGAVAEISGDELRGVPRRAAPGGGGEGDGETLGDAAAATAATVRENIRVRRAFAIAATGAGEVLGSYVHGAVAPGLGRQAAIVRLANVAGASGAKSAADKLAMHAVAAAPRFVDAASVPAAVAEAEAEIFRAQGAASGKPAAVVDKIVQGRMRKFHEEFCLAEQKCVFDDKVSATRWAREHGAGKDAAPDAFVRVKVGEGIEVEEKDFAAEVQATVRGA